ncbi:MAG: hypothetical protein QME65_05835, partial [Candidatus Omnitrophota bacterium]|nr:hypothetical protein [Candidatus Omnitrophota bacterium]
DETFNILVVTDYPANIERLKSLLKSVDQAPQQVLIEAKIVDMTSKDLQNLGVTWQIDYNPLGGLWDRGTDYSERMKGTGTFAGPSSSLTGGQIKIDTFVLKGLTATATLDALIQDQKANLLASPSIAVINNREARIIIGEKVPYKERTQTTTGTTETTKFIDVGTTLRVTPSINEDGYITMAIHPEVSSVSALLDAGPRITTREADTMVRVKEGETIVIGGLIKQEDNRVVSRMPILGYIPFFGYLFGNRSKDQTQQELTVFITPKILRSPEEMIAHGKKRYEDEAIVNITTTGSLNAQKVLLEKANHLDAAVGLESRRKEDWEAKNQAVSIYENILSQFPAGPAAPEAGYRAARIYFNDLNEPYRARELCAVIISNYPNSPYSYHAKELYKKIVTILEKERLEKLKKSGKKDYYREEDKSKAMGSAINRALDKEKVDEVRAAKLEARRQAEEETRQAKEEAKKAKLEAKRKADEERKIAREKAAAERAAKEEARKQELEQRRMIIEEARQAREEERQRILAQREKEKVAKIESQRKAKEKAEAERVARLEARRKAEEERKQKLEEARKTQEEARKGREEERKLAREKAEAERIAKEGARRKAKEKAEEIKQVEAELKAVERAKREQAREEARKVREEEKRIAREKAAAERVARLEAKRKAELEAKISREKARIRA